MKKFFRLTREFFWALFAFDNPLVYYRERLHRSPGKHVALALRNGPQYSLVANTNELLMVNEIWNMKVYDPLLRYVKDGSTVIDIGANVGIFTVKAARAAKNVHVFSYEPFPESFHALQNNIRLNGLERQVTATNVAVAGEKGQLELFYRANDPGGVSLHQFGDVSELSSIKVPAVTLEDILRDNNITTCDYLKLDCEGAEEPILLKTPKHVLEHIRTITLEWHYTINTISIDDMRKHLESLGYQTQYQSSTFTLYAERI